MDGAGGKGLVIGPAASKEKLARLKEQVQRDPRGWIAQPVVMLSTVPTLINGELQPRHVDLRPFAVNDGNKVWVLPGGLTRVALPEGQLVVNSSQGGGSKDTWCCRRRWNRPTRSGPGSRSTRPGWPTCPAPTRPDDTPASQQQQQQQQQRRDQGQEQQGSSSC